MKAKRILVIIVCLFIFSVLQVFALSETVNFSEMNSSIRKLDLSQYHNSGRIWLKSSNYGFIGSGNGLVPQFPSLEFPGGSGINYLYNGSVWIGAKKHRRNAAGAKLYWVAQQPSADSSAVIAEGDPGWNINMKAVIDTLVSVGFDGDKDLYELLPAYNPLESANIQIQGLYSLYNLQDNVMKSILSNPVPRSFSIPDTTGTYCFSIPTEQTGTEPGFETLYSYYYDYSPFNTVGDRDWGTSRLSNVHYPLKIAIEQKSYAFPLQNYDNLIIMKYSIYNTSTVDTLEDFCFGSYIDCDCGPEAIGSFAAYDDVSGYVMGGTEAGTYEFAYSRDYDGDGGLTPALIGVKLMLSDLNLNRSDWYWQIADGPDDWTPQSLSLSSRLTANEKYWLMTGRNPNPVVNSKYKALRGGPSGNVTEYEQPDPCETRFMTSFYGSQPTVTNPNPENRINLNPLSNIVFYVAIFAGNGLEQLKQSAVMAENLVLNNYDLGNMEGLTSFPYLTGVSQTTDWTVTLNWAAYTEPDQHNVMYKPTDAPDTQWETIPYPGTSSSGIVSGLINGVSYKFKVSAVFNPGPDEISLTSNTMEFVINNPVSNEDNTISPSISVSNYPNPFNPETTIEYEISGKCYSRLAIYNIKGQLINTLVDEIKEPGNYELKWNGKDRDNNQVGNGIYFCRLSVAGKDKVHKMLMLK